MGIKVAELNTLSDGKGITGIRFFNEMENTNECTNLRKLADVWVSMNHCCQGYIAIEALSVSLESLFTSDIPIKLIPHRFRSQVCRKMSLFTKLQGHKTEWGVHCCHAAVKTHRNLKE